MSGIDKMLKYSKGESRSLAGYRRRMERSPVHGWVSKRAKVACNPEGGRNKERRDTQMIIYMATCSKNSKSYIGVTKRPLTIRIRAHMRCVKDGVKTHFYNAIRKHGIDSFVWDVIDKVSPAQAFEREKYYISKFDTLKNGYNSTVGGEGDLAPTRETRAKRSIAMTGRTSPMKGRRQSDSAKALIGKNNARKRAKNRLQDQSHHFASYEMVSPYGATVAIESVRGFLAESGLSKTQFYRLARGERETLSGWKIVRRLS
jgi:group I intron endonuclease